MFELKITANTIEELLAKAGTLATLGVASPGSPEVPLPEPRTLAVEEEKPRRGRKPKDAPAAEPEEAMHAAEPDEEPVKETAEIEHVETDVSGNAAISDEPPHATPGAIYLLVSDRPNAQGRQVVYKDGKPFTSVLNPEVAKIPVYSQHAPEMAAEVAPDESDLSAEEHAGVDVDAYVAAVNEVEDARAGLPRRPTETGSAPPAEPEPDTSEPVTDASDDGASPAAVSGQSPPAADDVPDELALYGDEIENCGSWSEVLAVVKTFYGSAFYAGLPLEKQNLIRGRTWLNLKEIGNFLMPDPVADVSAFRLFLEAERDPEAISGSFAFLQKDPDSRWDRISEDAKATVRKAVDVRLASL